VNAPTRQHTPGPWTVRISQNGALRGYSIEHQDETLRSIVARNWEHELCEEHGNSLPNAMLLASAPDLLAALEKALESIEGQAELLRHCGAAYGIGATLAQARAAIAKATGGNAS
jgi:hypothetical protein